MPQRPTTRDHTWYGAELFRQAWEMNPRWKGVERPYSAEDVARLQGTVHIEHTLARLGAERFWNLLRREPPVRALDASTGNQAIDLVSAGLQTIYVSARQVRADSNTPGQIYPDQSACPTDNVSTLLLRINRALFRADQVTHAESKIGPYWFVPLIADAEAGFSRSVNTYELTRSMIEAGAACVHFDDQLSPVRQSELGGGKVLVPTSDAVEKLVSARLAADVMGVPTVLMARTDANIGTLLTSDVDPRDQIFLTGERTVEGFFRVRAGMKHAIARALSYAPYVDLLCCEPSVPDLEEARQFAEGVLSEYPAKMLAYNCSPTPNWRQYLNNESIKKFESELAAMGYRFIFVTEAGFQAQNASLFQLARRFSDVGVAACYELQEREHVVASRREAVDCAAYIDDVIQTIAGGIFDNRLC